MPNFSLNNDLTIRRTRYYQLNTQLAYLDNHQLNSLIDNDKGQTNSWGTNHVIKLGKSKIFVKKIPITEAEYTHFFSTQNLYNLPTYYNYGVGSAGFSISRELATHIKTTNWVLAGEIENFPLLYHYRILPRSGERPPFDHEKHKRYVKYWNSNEAIGRYMLDRSNATYELVLFLEYIPYALWTWLGKNMGSLDDFMEEMRDTISFLRQKGIIHFDVHFWNIVTDGQRPYLTDFGLVLDKQFDLSEDERSFFKQNSHYDYGEFLLGLGWQLPTILNRLAPTKKKKVMQKYAFDNETPAPQRIVILLKNINELHVDNFMNLDQNFVNTLVKYRDIILLMQAFFADMQQNDQKNTKYNRTRLKRLLKETGFLSLNHQNER